MSSMALTEAAIQRTVCTHLRMRPAPRLRLWFAIPNGGKRDARVGAILKQQGVQRGVLDILLFSMDGEKYALEIKTETGRPTEEQLEFKEAWEQTGGYACIARGLDRALATLEAWGLLVKHS